ncbi:class I SAM-dependent methyltransferase [bacterium]|nr:class I SAM-dependent methyltransferase [bacterium]
MSEWTNETAEWYAKQYREYETNRIVMDALALPKQGTVVDIGCGTGAAIRHAATLSAATRCIGIDPVPRMIEIAHERLEGFPHTDRIGDGKRGQTSNNLSCFIDICPPFASRDHSL